MEPNIWGNHAWLFLHTVTLHYPDNPTRFDKEKYKHFFESLSHVIPCDICRDHYKQNIKKFPINLDSKESLTRWLHKIHNLVNIKNGKEEFSYDKFIDKYSDLYSSNKYPKITIVNAINIFIKFLYFFMIINFSYLFILGL